MTVGAAVALSMLVGLVVVAWRLSRASAWSFAGLLAVILLGSALRIALVS